MKLYIAEKPSLARAIADALPKPHRKADGCIYVGNGDVVSWCIGHLLTQVDPEAYDPEYKKWKFEHLPIIPENWKLKSTPRTSKQLSILKKLIKQADNLVHVGDPDAVTSNCQLFDKVFIIYNSKALVGIYRSLFDRLKVSEFLTKTRAFIDPIWLYSASILTVFDDNIYSYLKGQS